MKENKVKIVKDELSNNQLQQNVQIAIELQSLLLKYNGNFSLLLIEG